MGRRRKLKRVVAENVTITGIADKGKGVGRDDQGRVIFVEGVVPGDIADVLVLKKRKGVLQGRVQNLVTPSPERIEAKCEHFGKCGGCKWQNLAYETQIKHKEIVVKDALQRIAKVEIGEFQPILGVTDEWYYRNKMNFTFSNKKWLTAEELNDETVSNEEDVLGFHRPGVYDKIVDIKHCWLQEDPSNTIRNTVKKIAVEQEISFHDSRARQGMLRDLIIRTNREGKALVVIAFFENEQDIIQPFLKAVQEALPQIISLYYVINPKLNDFIIDLPHNLYAGQEHIEESLSHVRFKIGPKSFFQTNTKQAEKLFDVVVDFANLQGTENVYDLYTGIGSIGLYMAKSAGTVVGIEEIAAAIEDAKENAALNGIENCTFYAGDVKAILTDEFAEKHGKPDLLITDPPRAGMHPKVVEMLLKLAAPRLIYVSCNPATQARDLVTLSEKYRVAKVRPVDMFPHTHHIENVALLELKNS